MGPNELNSLAVVVAAAAAFFRFVGAAFEMWTLQCNLSQANEIRFEIIQM